MVRVRPLRVGIYFNARREQGGLYQYAVSLVDCLNRYGTRHCYVLFYAGLNALPVHPQGENWQVVSLPPDAVRLRMGIEVGLMTLARLGLYFPLKVLPSFPQVDAARLDVMLYVKPTLHVFQWDYPCVFPVHDLQHRLQPQFPEVSAGGEWRRREYLYRNAIPKARAILVDSETGKEDVLSLYSADARRVFPLPYIAPEHLRSADLTSSSLEVVRQRYCLPQEYLFYPASFWTHKNHLRLLEAVCILREQHGVSARLVLAGGKRHDYPKVLEQVHRLGLSEQVFFLGYVPDEDMEALYRMAFALVMPTFFGPTNIPVLEAWAYDCPVITSDLRGIREQVGDAALLVDPQRAEQIAEAILRLYRQPDVRQTLIDLGKKRLQLWKPQHFASRLEEILAEVAL